MEINVNIKANKELTDAIIKMADAIELVAKRGIGNALFESDLLEKVVNEVKNEIGEPKAVEPKPVEQYTPNTQIPTGAVGQQVMPQMAQEPVQQAQQAFTPVAPAEPTPAVPTTEVSYDINQLAVAATGLVDAGKRDQLLALLSKFGVQALTMLPKDQYGAFATELRALGANI